MVAAWPRWVASYGVMPQTYIVAGPAGPGRVDAAPRRVVQRERRARCRAARHLVPGPGIHASQAYPAAADRTRQASSVTASHRWPGHRRPVLPAAPGSGRSSQQPVDPRPHVAATSAAVRCSPALAPSVAVELARAARRARPRPRPAAAGRPSPTAPCAACPRRGSTRRGRRRSTRPSGRRQHVPALAVGVVDHRVEARRAGPAAGRRRGPAAYASPSSSRAAATAQPAGRQLARRARSRPAARRRPARRSTAGRRRGRAGRRAARSAAPASQPVACGDQVRRDLPAGQRAVREVPQRPLAAHRLVDAAGGQRRRG